MSIAAAITEDVTPYLPRGVRLHRCRVRAGWFLLAPERALKMDAIGVAILNCIDGTRSFGAIVDKLASDFQVPRDRVAADAGKFLSDLADRRMVEVKS
ncbi:MAG: pyrroloquinoline quinone biosynthesis peptide chaperone PqqD [Pseudomonadota bacterium]